MNVGVVRCGLWANDLTRLRRPRPFRGDYAVVEVLPALASRLAAAMEVEECHIQGRLKRGCRAFAVQCGRGEIASWLWVSTCEEWAPPLGRTVRFLEADCYGWNAGTVQCHRGQGLCTALLECAGWQMAREGCHTMWNGIIDGNLASQRAHARAGYRPVLRVSAVHQLPPTRLFVRPADYADERLVERARRVVGLPATALAAEAQNGSEAAAVRPAGRRS